MSEDFGGGVIEPVPTNTHEHKKPFMKRTIQFLISISLFSFLISYFSGFPFLCSNNLQFSSLVLPFFVQALDRKYMFLICNGILAFLAKNIKTGGFVKNVIDQDVPKQIIVDQPSQMIEETVLQQEKDYYDPYQEKEISERIDERKLQEQDSQGGFHETVHGEVRTEYQAFLSGSEDLEEDDDESREKRVQVEISDAGISTEELNKKIEEFIRKMKEEIRIEAQQHLITV